MKDKLKFLVVCGYGCNLDSPLRPYLEKVAQFCRKERPDYIITSGGPTQQKSFPERTEASVMANYLHDQFYYEDRLDRDEYKPVWHMEGDSYTTLENILYAAEYIHRIQKERLILHEDITIFCEATRALKIAFLARRFMGFPPENGDPDIRIMTDSWERMHPSLEIAATIKDWLAVYIPGLYLLFRWQRMQKAKFR